MTTTVTKINFYGIIFQVTKETDAESWGEGNEFYRLYRTTWKYDDKVGYSRKHREQIMKTDRLATCIHEIADRLDRPQGF